MRNVIVFIALLFLCACNGSKKGTIHFIPISENELNYPADSTFAIPHGKVWDERKRIHDSCIGSSYAANAVFMRTRDTIPIGSIVDRRTMKVVDRSPFFSESSNQFSSLFSFETQPCYEKRAIDVPIDSFMSHQFLFKIDSSNNKVNDELMDAVRSSVFTEVEAGSWVNMELNNGLGKVLDTTTNERLLQYKKALLDSNNMILVRSSSVSEVSFYFHTQKPIPADLAKKLMTKPVPIDQPFFTLQFFYLDNTSFELKLNGYFQLLGQFMRCEVE